MVARLEGASFSQQTNAANAPAQTSIYMLPTHLQYLIIAIDCYRQNTLLPIVLPPFVKRIMLFLRRARVSYSSMGSMTQQ